VAAGVDHIDPICASSGFQAGGHGDLAMITTGSQKIDAARRPSGKISPRK
jgi:hypothetical protein